MGSSASVAVHRSRRAAAKLTGLLVALVTVATPAVPAMAATATRPVVRHAANDPVVPQLDWTACGGAFECASATVPLDYDQPRGATISLALIRLPATDPSRRIGSVFLNPGGPGGSGVDFVRGAGPFLFSDEVRARFDLVGFDPRGIMQSTPLLCFDNIDEAFSVLPPFAFPVGTAQERIWTRSDGSLAHACSQHANPIIDHMSTANVARDMDLLRQAVGDAKLTYAGYSYGSYLGTTYANLFPGKVRALIVDGVLDPIAWSTGRGNQARTLPFSTRLHSDQGANVTLQQFFKLCDHAAENCAFSAGDPEARYRKLARRLLDQPLELPDGVGGTITFTYADLVSLTLGAMYDPPSWPSLAETLAMLDALDEPAAVAGAIRALRTRLGAYDDYPNVVEGFPAVSCSDSDNPSDPHAWSVAARESDRKFGYFGRLWTWISSICAVWPGQDHDRFTGPFTRRTANPVLVIGNRFDPATRYQGAVTVANLLPRARLLTLAGWGHTSLFASVCIDNYVNRYLLTKSLPPKDKVCQPDVIPFEESSTGLRTSDVRPSRTTVIPPSIRRLIRGG